MLDVIITISKETPWEWVEQCGASVRHAADMAEVGGARVRPIYADGVPGHIGQAMADGFEQSTAEYVCWVDDDDFVLPGAFSLPIVGEPAAIFHREIHMQANGRLVPQNSRHHLTIYRRDVVESIDLTVFKAIPNVALIRTAEATKNVVDQMNWCYVRRIYRSRAMALRSTMDAQERAWL